MFCPKCGYDMQENTTCEKCGFDVKSAEETVEKTEVLEDISVDFDKAENVETEVEDEINATDEDMTVDFNQIDEVDTKKEKKSSGTWLVSLVSFIAGALACLIVVSCINGTFMSFFDKTVNGNPNDVVNNFLKTSFVTFDTKEYTNECSIYYRNSIVNQLKQYESQGYPIKVDTSLDITKDANFEKIAKFWLQGNASYKFKIAGVNAKEVEYYKSGSDEYKNYMNSYKTTGVEGVTKYSKNATMFAKVTFEMSYSIVPVEQTTTKETVTTTAKKDAKKAESKGKTTTTTTTTTAKNTTTTTKATTSKGAETGNVICVKENGSWRIFTDISWQQ